MRRKNSLHINVLIISLIFMLFWAVTAHLTFAAYYSIGIGNGGEAHEENISLEMGKKNITIGDISYLIGIALPFIDHGNDNIPDDTFGFPCPHDDYTSIGRKAEGMETGVVGKFGMQLFYPSMYISVLGGITRVHTIHITQSNPTQQYYEQSSKMALKGVGGISIGFFPELFEWRLKLTMQMDYDNRRGITGYVGWCW